MAEQTNQVQVTYSIGARFAGGGIGTTSSHAVRGLYRHHLLHRLLCGSYKPTEIPASRIQALGTVSRIWRKLAVYDGRYQLDHWYRRFYDHWAARHIQGGHIFHAWSGYSLHSLQRAKALGLTAVLDRALAHPIYLNKLLQAEYEKWGLPYRWRPTARRIQQEIKTADVVFIPSDFVRHTFVSEGESVENLVQIPFGADVQRFQPAPTPRSGQPFRALFMGHVSIRKGVPYLLQAWQQLKWPDAELWLAGQNRLPPALQQKFGQLPGVRFLGHVADPVSIFQQADLFVFPSIAEGSALVNYEAMACGLPVITTFNAGSVVQDGVEGFIIPGQDTAALATRLEQLRANPALRQRMGTAARQRAKLYTWERYGDRVAQALSQQGEKA